MSSKKNKPRLIYDNTPVAADYSRMLDFLAEAI
jgi:hypothetical protein